MSVGDDNAQDCCGCCGHEALPGSVWCAKCVEHIGRHGADWDRTFYALHRRPCPYQI